MNTLLKRVIDKGLNSSLSRAILRFVALYITKIISFDRDVLFVELIGPPGVGKSTIFDQLLKTKEKHDHWISRYSYARLIEPIDDDTDNLPEEYKKILEVKIGKTNLSDSALMKSKQVMVDIKRLKTDVVIHNSIMGATIISDESFLHHFGSSLVKMYDVYPDLVRKHLKRRAVIFCTSTPENIVSNINKRKLNGKTWQGHEGLNDEELYKKTNEILEKQNNTILLFKNLGVPVLEINTSGDIANIVNSVRQFIRSQTNSSYKNRIID